jgi:hypothetical protein
MTEFTARRAFIHAGENVIWTRHRTASASRRALSAAFGQFPDSFDGRMLPRMLIASTRPRLERARTSASGREKTAPGQ